MKFKYNDGGREAAGFQGITGDCVCRAIAIASQLPYTTVYEIINQFVLSERVTKRRKRRGKSTARTGVYKPTTKAIMDSLGWKWVPTMFIGQGCKVHLRESELPAGRLVVQVSKHLVAVVDGVMHDISECSREGTRCVYGYFVKE